MYKKSLSNERAQRQHQQSVHAAKWDFVMAAIVVVIAIPLSRLENGVHINETFRRW